MQIIKEGRQQKGWSSEQVCTGKGNGGGGCGAVLLVEYSDLYRVVSTDYGGGTDYYTTFTCCSCGVETDIDTYMGPQLTRSKSTVTEEN